MPTACWTLRRRALPQRCTTALLRSLTFGDEVHPPKWIWNILELLPDESPSGIVLTIARVRNESRVGMPANTHASRVVQNGQQNSASSPR